MGRTNFAAVSRVTIRDAADIFDTRRSIDAIAADCAFEALRVLHDGLSNPDDKIRMQCAGSIVNAHCKLATLKVPQTPQLPPEERVARLRAALQEPDSELHEALRLSGWQQVQK